MGSFLVMIEMRRYNEVKGNFDFPQLSLISSVHLYFCSFLLCDRLGFCISTLTCPIQARVIGAPRFVIYPLRRESFVLGHIGHIWRQIAQKRTSKPRVLRWSKAASCPVCRETWKHDIRKQNWWVCGIFWLLLLCERHQDKVMKPATKQSGTAQSHWNTWKSPTKNRDCNVVRVFCTHHHTSSRRSYFSQ